MTPVARSLIVGVAGGSGSGKTTVARAIHEPLGVDAVLLDADSYYCDLSDLGFDERKAVNYDHPDAFDVPLLVEQLNQLARGHAVQKPTYDYALHTRAQTRMHVEPREVILVDGILLFADARLRSLFDIKVFVDVAEDIRFIRRLRRDIQERGRSLDSVIEQYLSTVRPMHLEFVEPSKRYADVILPEGGQNQIGIEMIRARVEKELAVRREAARG
ncbi:MAG TPA: uridine kinase [Gemmatimonadales bacterium]|nr:uridine kinase [Gemmatimonadales bacterium]